MLRIPLGTNLMVRQSARNNGTTQTDALAGMHRPLRDLVEKNPEMAQWAAKLNVGEQLCFSEQICDLINKDIFKPADILKLGTFLTCLIEASSIIRGLLVDLLIDVDQLLALEFNHHMQLAEHEVQSKLDSAEIRQKLKEGSATLKEILADSGEKRLEISSIRSSSGSAFSMGTVNSYSRGISALSSPSSISTCRREKPSTVTDKEFDPFSPYIKGKVQSFGGRHYLRRYDLVLWILDDKDPKNGIRRVYSPISGSFNEFPMSLAEIAELRAHIESGKIKEEQNNKKLESLKKPLSGAKEVDFAKHEVRAIIQGEYAVANARSKQPILGTYAAGPCIIMALYDSKNKIAVLAHIDTSIDTRSLPDTLIGLSKTHTCAHLYGGDSLSKELCMDVVDFLECEKIKIENSDIVRSGAASKSGSEPAAELESASLAIDSRSGQIYTPFRYTDFIQDSSHAIRTKFCQFGFFSKRPLTKF